MDPALIALEKALVSSEVVEAIALAREEPEAPSSQRVIRAVETARVVLGGKAEGEGR